MHYVCGFAFDPTGEWVVLIRKAKPAWQAGKLNGVGGKVEPGEAPLLAMIREFREETGVSTDFRAWKQFATVSGDDWTVHFFHLRLGLDANVQTMEDEAVDWYPVAHTPDRINNLSWLIPMALATSPVRADVQEITP